MPETARRQWVCPHCRQSWDIPAGAADPERCPKCPPPFKVEFQAIPKPVRDSDQPQLASRWQWFGALLLLAAVAGGAIYFAGQTKAGRAINQAVVLPVVDREFALVDRYLKENLDDGEYEAVRWWPAIDRRPSSEKWLREYTDEIEALTASIEKNKAEIELLKKVGAQGDSQEISRCQSAISSSQLYLDIAQSRAAEIAVTLGDRVGRLRYRRTNRFGAKEIQDDFFVIRQDHVYVADGEARRRLQPIFGEMADELPVNAADVLDAAIEAQRRNR